MFDNFHVWSFVFSTLVSFYITPTLTFVIAVSTVMKHPFCTRTFLYGNWGEGGVHPWTVLDRLRVLGAVTLLYIGVVSGRVTMFNHLESSIVLIGY
jgi:hypothetical protein